MSLENIMANAPWQKKESPEPPEDQATQMGRISGIMSDVVIGSSINLLQSAIDLRIGSLNVLAMKLPPGEVKNIVEYELDELIKIKKDRLQPIRDHVTQVQQILTQMGVAS